MVNDFKITILEISVNFDYSKAAKLIPKGRIPYKISLWVLRFNPRLVFVGFVLFNLCISKN